jgi:Mn-containing catalase
VADDPIIATLNEYRAAELSGASVIMRLGRMSSDSRVRTNLTAHLRDECNHAWLWTKLINDLGGMVEQVDDPYQGRLGVHFGLPRSIGELLALTIVAERRGVTTYQEHLDTVDELRVRRTIGAVLKDERWHVEWITEWFTALRVDEPALAEALERAEAADALAMREIDELRIAATHSAGKPL